MSVTNSAGTAEQSHANKKLNFTLTSRSARKWVRKSNNSRDMGGRYVGNSRTPCRTCGDLRELWVEWTSDERQLALYNPFDFHI